MTPTVVVDLDKVLLGGDGRHALPVRTPAPEPGRALPLLAARRCCSPVGPAVDPAGRRPLLTRWRWAAAARTTSTRWPAPTGRRWPASPRPPSAEAIACVRAHRRQGHRVVVATGCEETMARGTSPRSAWRTSTWSARPAR
jgi:phosphatidylglycerophosphatase C